MAPYRRVAALFISSAVVGDLPTMPPLDGSSTMPISSSARRSSSPLSSLRSSASRSSPYLSLYAFLSAAIAVASLPSFCSDT